MNYKPRFFKTENYNYIFKPTDGFFARWGKTQEEDPEFSPFGPEIADIEIVNKCKGMTGNLNGLSKEQLKKVSSLKKDGLKKPLRGPCEYCYKSNNLKGDHMSLETFKKVIENLNVNKQLTQVALGADADCSLNPEIWDIMKYCRDNDIVPNITVAEVNDDLADKLVEHCGAVAVSFHDDWATFTQSVYNLTSRGMKQVNCHMVIMEESYDDTLELFHRKNTDPMLAGLNAIVLLSLKKCGRAKEGNFNVLSQERLNELVKVAFDYNIPIGFDSCTANTFEKSLDILEKSDEEKDSIRQMIEPCESMLFSIYVNTYGKITPCSFTEDLYEGFDVVNCNDFLKECWNNPDIFKSWRKRLLNNQRSCLDYTIR